MCKKHLKVKGTLENICIIFSSCIEFLFKKNKKNTKNVTGKKMAKVTSTARNTKTPNPMTDGQLCPETCMSP